MRAATAQPARAAKDDQAGIATLVKDRARKAQYV